MEGAVVKGGDEETAVVAGAGLHLFPDGIRLGRKPHFPEIVIRIAQIAHVDGSATLAASDIFVVA